jgi:hypothetical protein
MIDDGLTGRARHFKLALRPASTGVGHPRPCECRCLVLRGAGMMESDSLVAQCGDRWVKRFFRGRFEDSAICGRGSEVKLGRVDSFGNVAEREITSGRQRAA